jgi:hypothetical protein
MIGSCLDRRTVPQLHAVNRPDTVIDPMSNSRVVGAEIIVDALHYDVFVVRELIDPDSPTSSSVEHKRVSC